MPIAGHEGWLLAVLLVLGLAIRLWVLVAADELNADEALPGLMSRHIVAGQARPVFFYGQHYFGAVEAYILAGLFAVFGFHPWLAVVPPTIASLTLIPITFGLGRYLGGPTAGWLAALLVAVPPPFLARLYTNSGGGFSLAFALHGATLLTFLWAFTAPGGGAHPAAGPALRRLAICSLLAGVFGWVWQPGLVLLPCLVAILVWRRPALRHPRLLLAIAPVALGLAPPLLYNALSGWPTAAQLASKYATTPGVEANPGLGSGPAAIAALLFIAFGGGSEAEGGTNHVQGALVAIAIPLTLLLVHGAHGGRPAAAGRRAAARLLALAILLDTAAAHGTARHLGPAAHLGFAFAGAALAGLGRRLFPHQPAAGQLTAVLAALCLVVAPNLYLSLRAATLFRHFVPRASDVAAAVTFLEARGLTAGYADYWTAYPVTYLSGERIIVAPVVASVWGERTDRYPPYAARVDASGQPERLFLLLDGRCSPLPYLLPLEQAAADYRLERTGPWYLLWDIRPQPDRVEATLAAWRRVIAGRGHC